MKIPIKITTPSEEVQFNYDSNKTAAKLFKYTCKYVNLREHWYFGLYYIIEDQKIWIDESKKKLAVYEDHAQRLHLTVKCYPEDISNGILFPEAINVFYLEIQKKILLGEIYCPSSVYCLLAAFSAHASYTKAGPSLLPERLYDQHNINKVELIKSIDSMCKKVELTCSAHDAKMEYLMLTETLEMFGIHYFNVTTIANIPLHLGYGALGINIYIDNDKLNPRINYQWPEVDRLILNHNMFCIKFINKKKIYLICTNNTVMNKNILKLGRSFQNYNRMMEKVKRIDEKKKIQMIRQIQIYESIIAKYTKETDKKSSKGNKMQIKRLKEKITNLEQKISENVYQSNIPLNIEVQLNREMRVLELELSEMKILEKESQEDKIFQGNLRERATKHNLLDRIHQMDLNKRVELFKKIK